MSVVLEILGVGCADVWQVRQDHAQVVAERFLGGIRFAAADGVDDGLVLLDHLGDVARLGQAQAAHAVEMSVRARNDRPRNRAPAQLAERRGQLIVEAEERIGIGGVACRLLMRDDGAELGDAAAVGALCGEPHGRALERLAQELRVVDARDADAAHKRSELRDDLDELVVAQARERFAYRRPADAELVGDLVLRDLPSGLELGRDDRVAQGFIDGKPGAAAVGARDTGEGARADVCILAYKLGSVNVNTRTLGSGPTVSQVGLGCMAMSGAYGPSDEQEAVATIRAARDAGVTLIDTGDFYGMGHNELLIGRALQGRSRDDVVISVKFGGMRGPDNAILGYDARPAAVKNFAAYSLQRLRTDYIDVYRPARLDPNVPIEETVGAIKELIDAGYVRHVGLSEIGVETLRRADAVQPVCDLQIEYSLISRGIETEILPAARELGVAISAYGILSRGLLSGRWSPDRELGRGDFRARAPRFSGENLQRNLDLVERLRAVADASGATVAQLAIAWVASRGEDIVPLIGARDRDQLQEALAGAELELTPDQLAQIEAAVPAGAAA